MKLKVFSGSLLVQPLRPGMINGVYRTDQTKDTPPNVCRVMGVGEGYYVPEKDAYEPLPYKIDDLIAVNPDGLYSMDLDGDTYWRINSQDVMATIEDLDVSEYEEVK